MRRLLQDRVHRQLDNFRQMLLKPDQMADNFGSTFGPKLAEQGWCIGSAMFIKKGLGDDYVCQNCQKYVLTWDHQSKEIVGFNEFWMRLKKDCEVEVEESSQKKTKSEDLFRQLVQTDITHGARLQSTIHHA